MVTRRTSLRRHFGQYHGNGRVVSGSPLGFKGSGIVDTHYFQGRIVRVVVLQEGLDVDTPAGQHQSKVVMERPQVPLRASLFDLVDNSAAFQKIVHGFGNRFQVQGSQVVGDP